MKHEDREYIAAIGQWFYGVKPHTPNAGVAGVLAKMIAAVMNESDALAQMPAAPSSWPGPIWFFSEGVQNGFRALNSGDAGQDEAKARAVTTVAEQFQVEYDVAQLGY